MSDSVKDLIVRILVDDDQTSKFSSTAAKALSLGNVLNKAAIASAGALALLAGGALLAGKAAASAQVDEEGLQFALSKFPATADVSASELMKLNEQLSMHTKFTQEDYASGQAILAQFGLTGAQIKQLTPLLGDYAAKTGQDLPAAADALGKALLGQGRALKTVGVNFTDTKTLGGNYQELLEGLTDKVGGFATAQGKTAAGSSAILGNSINDLEVKLGKSLLPTMVKVTQAGVGIIDWMTKNSSIVTALAGGLGTLAVGILALSAGMKIYAAVQAAQAIATDTATAAQWANNAAWLADPMTWIILAIIVVIALLVAAGIWLYDNWGSVTKWIGQAWSNVCSWFQSVGATIVKWWNDFWNGLGDWAKNTFGPAVNFVIDNWKDFQKGLALVGDAITKWWNDFWNGLVSWEISTFGPATKWVLDTFAQFQVGLKILGADISSWWNGLWSGIGNFFANVWSGFQGIVRSTWDGIITWIQDGVNGAISLLNGVIRGVNNIGGSIGVHLSLIPNVTIPRLATGGITMGPTLAMVGDNPGGRELILPLDSPTGRELLGGGRPVQIDEKSLDYLARKLSGYVRVQSRTGAAV